MWIIQRSHRDFWRKIEGLSFTTEAEAIEHLTRTGMCFMPDRYRIVYRKR